MSDSENREDLGTIGVTDEAEAIIRRILERGWFGHEMNVFKAAVAFGIAKGIPPTVSGKFATKWNIGSLDRTGEFIDVVTLFHSEPRPWDYVRRVGDAALKAIEPRIDSAEVPSELFLDHIPR